MCWTHREVVPCGPLGATRGRHLVVAALADLMQAAGHVGDPGADARDRELVYDAGVVATELLSNAARVCRTVLEITVEVHHDHVRLAVFDDGPGRPRQVEALAGDVGGRGLQIVDALCSSWGTEPRGAGKCVWCQLTVSTASLTHLDCTDHASG